MQRLLECVARISAQNACADGFTVWYALGFLQNRTVNSDFAFVWLG